MNIYRHEASLVPAAYSWLTFDGDNKDDGTGSITFKSLSTAYAQTLRGMATSGQTGYADTLPLPSENAPWTISEVLLASTNDNAVLFSIGQKNSTGGIALIRVGMNETETKDVINLYNWSNGGDAAPTITRLASAEVENATGAFHHYVLVVDPSEISRSIALWIDGVQVTNDVGVTFAGNPSKGSFQFGGIHSGEGNTGWKKVSDTILDDFRFFQTALTEAQIKELATEFPVSKRTEYTIAPTEDLLIGENDVAVFKGNLAYNGSHKISGKGVLVIREGKTSFTHPSGTNNPMSEFAGTMVVCYKGTAYYGDSGVWAEENDPFGPCSFRLVEGGKIDGFKIRNNVGFTGDVEVLGTDYECSFNSTEAHSGNGCNIKLYGNIKGDGNLTVQNNERVNKFYGLTDDFTGTLTTSASGNYGGIEIHSGFGANSSSTWTMKTGTKAISLYPTDNETISFGNLIIHEAAEIKINNSATSTVKIGTRGGDSLINAPMTQNKTTICKVGNGTLTLGETFSVVEGSSLFVEDGSIVSIASTPLTCDITFGENSTYQVSAEQDASHQTINLVTIASGYQTNGKPKVSVEGKDQSCWHANWKTNADGSKTLRIAPPTFVFLIR